MKSKEQKHEEALKRQARYDNLPLKDKLNVATSQRGKSVKERLRLVSRLQHEAYGKKAKEERKENKRKKKKNKKKGKSK